MLVIILPVFVFTSPCILKSVVFKNFQRLLVFLLKNCALLTSGVTNVVGSENTVAKRPGLARTNASVNANGYVELYLNAFSTGAPSPNFHTPSVPVPFARVIALVLDIAAVAVELVAPANVLLSLPVIIMSTLALTPPPPVIVAVA
jgi:hypothetical protein